MKGIEKTVQAIKDAGFGFIKVELEAQLNRPYGDSDYSYETCDNCEGEGNIHCDTCDGEGYNEVELTRPDGSVSDMTEEVTCDDCSGDGHTMCYTCDGDGEVEVDREATDFGSEDYCQNYILDYISKEAKDALIFSRFYNDGSVDSEFTFTIAIDDSKYLPEIINSFNALAEANGEGMDVAGAGMHVAVLPHESRGIYPVPSSFEMPHDKLSNFRSEVTKLLPALFIAATSGNFSRGLGYRHPKIDTDKYSAIHIVSGRCLEYRLFETCYQRPEAIFEYMQTIARTLEYYKDPSKKVEAQGKEYVFYGNDGVKGLTSTPDQVRIIKKQLKMVIGKDITLKSFMQAREIDLSVQARTKDFNKKMTRVRKMYKEALADYEHRVSRPLEGYEIERYREHERYDYFSPGMTDKQKIAYVRGISEVGTEEQFINRNAMNMRLTTSLAV